VLVNVIYVAGTAGSHAHDGRSSRAKHLLSHEQAHQHRHELVFFSTCHLSLYCCVLCTLPWTFKQHSEYYSFLWKSVACLVIPFTQAQKFGQTISGYLGCQCCCGTALVIRWLQQPATCHALSLGTYAHTHLDHLAVQPVNAGSLWTGWQWGSMPRLKPYGCGCPDGVLCMSCVVCSVLSTLA
jgi:hypothetical protein